MGFEEKVRFRDLIGRNFVFFYCRYGVFLLEIWVYYLEVFNKSILFNFMIKISLGLFGFFFC